MQNKNNPCWKCTDRHIGCHAECSKYSAFHKQNMQRSRKNCIDAILSNEHRDAVRHSKRKDMQRWKRGRYKNF